MIAPRDMPWALSSRADRRALPLADRHYNRQKPGSPQFVPPGRCLVLLTPAADALWVTSWPIAEYVKHDWAGAWLCSLFRREGGGLSSDLIREAVAATRWRWPEVPPLGIVTFVNPEKTRRKRDPGRCYLRAGWRYAGHHRLTPDCPACARRIERHPRAPRPCGLTQDEGCVALQQLPDSPTSAPRSTAWPSSSPRSALSRPPRRPHEPLSPQMAGGPGERFLRGSAGAGGCGVRACSLCHKPGHNRRTCDRRRRAARAARAARRALRPAWGAFGGLLVREPVPPPPPGPEVRTPGVA